jgi:hypothetical protein
VLEIYQECEDVADRLYERIASAYHALGLYTERPPQAWTREDWATIQATADTLQDAVSQAHTLQLAPSPDWGKVLGVFRDMITRLDTAETEEG